MFGFLKKKEKLKQDQGRLRGVLPTYVTDESVILCKSSNIIRNTYEIRLALFMAIAEKKRFILAVPIGAQVSPDLQSKISQHDGTIEEMVVKDYSVYIGHSDAQGAEGYGWVLGGDDAWNDFCETLNSSWLKERFKVGGNFGSEDFERFEKELMHERISQTNLDEENIKDALLALVVAAREHGGELYIQ